MVRQFTVLIIISFNKLSQNRIAFVQNVFTILYSGYLRGLRTGEAFTFLAVLALTEPMTFSTKFSELLHCRLLKHVFLILMLKTMPSITFKTNI